MRLLLLWAFLPLVAFAADTVKIGVIAPMAGVLADYGQSLIKATTLAQEDAGDTQLSYEFIFEDSHDDQTRFSVLAAQKLTHIDKVNAVISMWDAWFSVSPTTSANGIVQLGLGWDRRKKQSDLDFLCYTSTYDLVNTFLTQAKERGYKKIAMLATKGGGSLLMQKDVTEIAAAMGIEVTLIEMVNPGTRDFRTLLAKTEDSKAELIMCVMWPPMLDAFLRQYLDFQTKIPLAGIEIWRDSNLANQFEGSWEVTADDPNGELEQRYTERFDERPAIITTYAYDAASLLIEAHEALYTKLGKVPSGEQVADWIKQHEQFEFINGQTTLNEFNHIGFEPNVVELKAGARVLQQ